MSEEKLKAPEKEAQFIGPDKILEVSEEDFTTPGGHAVLKIKYEGGREEILSRKAFDIMVTTEKSDYNDAYAKRRAVVVQELLAVFRDNDVRFFEIAGIVQEFGNVAEIDFDSATNWLWTGKNDSFSPGSNPINTRGFMEAYKITKDIPPQKDEPKDTK